MPLPNSNITAITEAVKAVLSDKDQQKLVDGELKKVNGDWAAALPVLQSKLTPDVFQ